MLYDIIHIPAYVSVIYYDTLWFWYVHLWHPEAREHPRKQSATISIAVPTCSKPEVPHLNCEWFRVVHQRVPVPLHQDVVLNQFGIVWSKWGWVGGWLWWACSLLPSTVLGAPKLCRPTWGHIVTNKGCQVPLWLHTGAIVSTFRFLCSMF